MMGKCVGILADDITGSNDIGIMLAKNGYRTGVFSLKRHPAITKEIWHKLDCVVVDIDCRLDTAQEAARKTAEGMALLQQMQCDVFCGKTCSVFRGNVGAHLETMGNALESCGMVVLGFPKNGRTTVNGQHYVNDVPLSKTMFANDPIHPMDEDNLLNILRKQSNKGIASFSYEWLDASTKEQQTHLEQLRKENDFIIFDVRSQQDLITLAHLLKDETFICGSSAIWEELPKAWGDTAQANAQTVSWQDDTGVLVLAGSLTMPTKRQVNYLRQRGMAAYELPTWLLFDEIRQGQIIDEISDKLAAHIAAGEDVLLHTAQDSEQVAQTKACGYILGLNDSDIGWRVSATLSAICKNVLAKTNARKLIVAGGDTSAAISEQVGVDEMYILQEIETGVPVMLGTGKHMTQMLLVYKSGSFGSDAFLEKSVLLLKQIVHGGFTAANQHLDAGY